MSNYVVFDLSHLVRPPSLFPHNIKKLSLEHTPNQIDTLYEEVQTQYDAIRRKRRGSEAKFIGLNPRILVFVSCILRVLVVSYKQSIPAIASVTVKGLRLDLTTMYARLLASLVGLTTLHSVYAIPLSATASSSASESPLPLIIWHGLGDNYAADGLKAIAQLAEQVNPGTFVYIVRLAEDPSDDRKATFFGNLTNQVAQVCEDLATHPILSKAAAVNALGFSQGGPFLRAYIERCNSPPVRNFVTFGSPHNGIARFQGCNPTDWLCKTTDNLLKANTWSKFSQSTLVPAQYYRNEDDLDSYLEYSNLLADINNERTVKNQTYKENISRLKNFVMYLFEEDETVIPKESAWFAEVNATTAEVTPLQNRTMYKEDWLGLKELDEQGGLIFEQLPGKHMQIKESTLKKAFKEYFSPESNVLLAIEDSVSDDNEWIMVDPDTDSVWEDL